MASGDIESHRSMILAASGSVARACAFSSSVIVITRKCEDLVDLGGVVQCAFALFGDLGVVVEDDRRHQHHVGLAWRAGEHRETTVLPAAGHGVDGSVGRFEQGNELTVGDLGYQVRTDQ